MGLPTLFASLRSSPSPQPTSTELEEMYKKNFELAEKNKTLSILRKIDEIILSSITNITEIAHTVSKILVEEADFRIAGIYVHNDDTSLRRLAVFVNEGSYQTNEEILKKIDRVIDIPLTSTHNILVSSYQTRQIIQTMRVYDILGEESQITADEAENIQRNVNIKTSFVYPLIVRSQSIGVMFICLNESIEDLSEYQKDLLARVHPVIGIAMDNALLYNQVQESNEKLKALDKLKDEFVSLASHELRTPMTAIKSYIWMALDGRGGPLSEKMKYYLTRAYLSTNRLINMVNDMLNISRIESGRLFVQLQGVDLYKLAQEVIEEVMPRANELSVHVELVPLTTPLPPVLADPDKIKEVFINLIGNSLKFTPKDGIVKVAMVQKGDSVATQITDTGSGIDPVELPKLFQKFSMIASSYATSQSVQGTGLGLYICKALIGLHQGSIFASSEGLGKGATFTFVLRIFRPEDAAKYSVTGNGQKVGIVHSQI